MNNSLSQPPKISWDKQGQPKSEYFDDFYFNTDNGLEESRYVFLDKNNLKSRWQANNLNADTNKAQQTFTIAETGFGTGLNFLATWQLWLQCAPCNTQLHFISVEKYPLSRAQIAKALALWPELKTQADALIEQYPLHIFTGQPSVHRLTFKQGEIKLTLIFDDAIAGLKQLAPSANATPCVALQHAHYSATPQKINAWFLDGFSPAKNPDMWQPALFQLVAKLSQKNTTLSTFTAIKSLREGLSSVGFTIKKTTGFGKKREMVTAVFKEDHIALTQDHAIKKTDSTIRLTQPKASRQRAQSAEIPSASWHLQPNMGVTKKPKNIAVIGAGLAGSHSANALARQGLQVTVFDQGTIANGASGNPQGVVYTRFSHQQDTLATFNACALPFADNFYANNLDYKNFGSRTGVLHLATNLKNQALQQLIAEQYNNINDSNENQNILHWCNANQAATKAGVDLKLGLGGLFTPLGGWLQPAKVCAQLLNHPNINIYLNTPVQALLRVDNDWHIKINNKPGSCYEFDTAVFDAFVFDAVVIATAHNASEFQQTDYLNLKPIRGQITHTEIERQETPNIKTCICGEGYIAPALSGASTSSEATINTLTFGATFSPKNASCEVTQEDNISNLKMLSDLIEWPNQALDKTKLSGRTSFRCTTRDYLPFVGPVANSEAMKDVFSRYRKNKYAIIDRTGQYHNNLFVNVGHGSRGLAYTPLCAEVISSLITGSALPITQELYKQLHPSRFLIRDLAQNKI